MFLSFLCISAFLRLALAARSEVVARDDYWPPTIHEVTVGGLLGDAKTPNLAFNPAVIQAKKGEIVRFTFNAKNHTVTQSSFDSPCSKMDGGFDTGFTNAVGFNQSSDFPTFDFTVTDDSKPIWGYCRQAPPPPGPTHCQSGMVFAINPPSYGNTFEKFLTTAKASHEQSQPLTHYVTVGGVKSDGTPNLAYDPPIVKASPGDKVHFIFNIKNHTVTQSSFGSPCEKLYNGFDSQFNPVGANTTSDFPSFEITVNDTNPIWGYCRQKNPSSHCGAGMVFAVNPPDFGNTTFDAFKARAIKEQGASTTSSVAYASATSSVCSSQPTTHHVTVGGLQADGKTPNLKYDPPYVQANPGDTIQFKFMVKNHTVTQSTFENPCEKVYGGFDSEFKAVSPAQAYDLPTFEILVNDTKPIWTYCRQTNPVSHCGAGMVFAVNPPAYGNTFDKFLWKAKAQGSGTSNSSGFSNSSSCFTSGAKDVSLSSASTSGDSTDSDNISKLLRYIPAVLGLLGVAVFLMLTLCVIGILLLRRSRGSSWSSRSVSPSYQPVRVSGPSMKAEQARFHDDVANYGDGA